MSAHSKNRMSSPARRPTLEVLDSRCNPSTVHFDHGTLVIVGTRDADTVAVVDDGQGESAGHIRQHGRRPQLASRLRRKWRQSK